MYNFEIREEFGDYLSYIEKSKIGRHVKWLNNQKKIYKSVEKGCLYASIIGIPLAKKINKISDERRKYYKFRNDVLSTVPPSMDIKIAIKEATKTFNHVDDYIIHNGMIWYRRRNCCWDNWKALYFDGYPDRSPLELYADGENLMVLVNVDGEYYLHYKKILEERLLIFADEAAKHKPSQRKRYISISNNDFEFTLIDNFIWFRSEGAEEWKPLWYEGWPNEIIATINICDNILEVFTENDAIYEINVSTDNINELLAEYEFPYKYRYYYSASITNEINNWSDRWFTFPYFWLYKMNPKKEKRLKIPDAELFPLKNISNVLAMSNRGKFTQYYENELGGQHPCYVAVTGVYIVLNNRIYLADPWLPRQFNEKSFPLIINDKYIDPPRGLVIKKLSVSASLIVIYCMDNDDNEYVMYRFEDFDSMGINPALSYIEVSEAIARENIKPSVRVLKDNYKNLEPEECWTELDMQDIMSKDVDFYTLTVLQTGKGNFSRTIRIQTIDLRGYYETTLTDNHWTFVQY